MTYFFGMYLNLIFSLQENSDFAAGMLYNRSDKKISYFLSSISLIFTEEQVIS